MIPSTQFGSTCGDSKYETEAHTVTVATEINATEKMKIFANVMYSDVTSKITDFKPAAMATTTDAILLALYDNNNLALYPEYSALHTNREKSTWGAPITLPRRSTQLPRQDSRCLATSTPAAATFILMEIRPVRFIPVHWESATNFKS